MKQKLKSIVDRIGISATISISIVIGLICLHIYSTPAVVEYDNVVTEYKTIQIEITDIDPPPYYDIVFKSLDGTLKGKMESRRCDEWKHIQVGNIYTLEYYTITKTDDNHVVDRIINLPNACTFAKYAKVVKYAEVKY